MALDSNQSFGKHLQIIFTLFISFAFAISHLQKKLLDIVLINTYIQLELIILLHLLKELKQKFPLDQSISCLETPRGVRRIVFRKPWLATASYVVLHESLIDDLSKPKTLCFMKSTKHKGSHSETAFSLLLIEKFQYIFNRYQRAWKKECQNANEMGNGNSVVSRYLLLY